MKDCNSCKFWRRRAARMMGHAIPDGDGKCTRPKGPCNPAVVRGVAPTTVIRRAAADRKSRVTPAERADLYAGMDRAGIGADDPPEAA